MPRPKYKRLGKRAILREGDEYYGIDSLFRWIIIPNDYIGRKTSIFGPTVYFRRKLKTK